MPAYIHMWCAWPRKKRNIIISSSVRSCLCIRWAVCRFSKYRKKISFSSFSRSCLFSFCEYFSFCCVYSAPSFFAVRCWASHGEMINATHYTMCLVYWLDPLSSTRQKKCIAHTHRFIHTYSMFCVSVLLIVYIRSLFFFCVSFPIFFDLYIYWKLVCWLCSSKALCFAKDHFVVLSECERKVHLKTRDTSRIMKWQQFKAHASLSVSTAHRVAIWKFWLYHRMRMYNENGQLNVIHTRIPWTFKAYMLCQCLHDTSILSLFSVWLNVLSIALPLFLVVTRFFLSYSISQCVLLNKKIGFSLFIKFLKCCECALVSATTFPWPENSCNFGSSKLRKPKKSETRTNLFHTCDTFYNFSTSIDSCTYTHYTIHRTWNSVFLGAVVSFA